MNERTRFGGKAAVITGGASGIGAATARLLHAEGASVVIGDLDAAAGNALVAELGAERTRFITTDVSDFGSVTALIDGAVAAFRRIDVLVNNAGIGSLSSIAALPVEDWKKVLAINLDGVFFGCKAAPAGDGRAAGRGDRQHRLGFGPRRRLRIRGLQRCEGRRHQFHPHRSNRSCA